MQAIVEGKGTDIDKDLNILLEKASLLDEHAQAMEPQNTKQASHLERSKTEIFIQLQALKEGLDTVYKNVETKVLDDFLHCEVKLKTSVQHQDDKTNEIKRCWCNQVSD